MGSKLIIQALDDIIPLYDKDEYPTKLVKYIERLYNLSSSKITLKQEEEISRYHLCSILAIEKFNGTQDEVLPDPLIDKIPLAPNKVNKLLEQFKFEIFTGSRSNTPQFMTTPSRRSSRLNSLQNTPTRANNINSSKINHEKKLVNSEKIPLKNVSPFITSTSTSTTPTRTILKDQSSPYLLSPSKSKNLSTAQVISFCNKFHITRDITTNILKSFKNLHNRIKNEWALLCGIVGTVYLRINEKQLDAKIGLRQRFIDKLHLLQNGGLLKKQMQHWINLIENLIKNEKWIKMLEIEYNYSKNGILQTEQYTIGNMIISEVKFSSQKKLQYLDWKANLC